MRQLRARFKREKCKYKRCTFRRTEPVEKPRFCMKHWLYLAPDCGPTFDHGNVASQHLTLKDMEEAYALALGDSKDDKPGLLQRIKAWCWEPLN